MKNYKENAQRWLKQSGYDLNEARRCLQNEGYSYACFFAEQSAQKSTKAFLISRGKRFIAVHSVGELLKEAAVFDESFLPLVDSGKKIDLYYLASRYPDALPEPAVPFEYYTKDQADESVSIAEKIFENSRRLIG